MTVKSVGYAPSSNPNANLNSQVYAGSKPNNQKRHDVAVAGAGAGTAVVARELTTLKKVSTVARSAAETAAKGKKAAVMNVFAHFGRFLRTNVPGAARLVSSPAVQRVVSKPVLRGTLGVFGSVLAGAVTVAELFNTGSVIEQMGNMVVQKQGR